MAGEAEIERMVVRILGDPSQYERSLKTAGKATTTFVQRVTKQLRAVSQGMKNMGRSVSFRVTAPLMLMGVAAIKVGADFQKGFTGVRKTVDATEAELAVLRQGFKDLSLEVPVAVEELLKIGESAGQLGIATENVLSFTKTIAAMGVATNLTTEEAATSMARFANIAGMSQSEFSNLGSSIVALGNSLATTEQEILGMSMRLAGAGTTIGLTESQILAFAASLSSVGLRAEAGGTAFSKLFLSLQTAVALGSEDLEAFARVAGVTTEQFAQGFREDAAGSVRDLLRAIGGLGPEMKVLALKELGLAESVRMTDSILRMSGAVDLLDRSLELSEKSFRENKALAEEAAQAYKTFWSQLTLLKNQMKVLLDDVFVLMEPTLRAIVDRVKSLVGWLAKLSPEIKRTIIIVSVVAALIGPALLFLGSALGAVGFAAMGLGALWTGLGLAIAAVLSPIGLTIAAVVALGAAVVAFTDVGGIALVWFGDQWDKLLEHIEPAMRGIKDALSAGDLQLAMEVGWAQIQLSFAQAIKPLQEIWVGFTLNMKTVWVDTAKVLVDTFITASTEIAKGLVGLEMGLGRITESQAQAKGVALDMLGFFLKSEAKGKIDEFVKETEDRASEALGALNTKIMGLTGRRDKLVGQAALDAAQAANQIIGQGILGKPGLTAGEGRIGGGLLGERGEPTTIQAARVGTAEAQERITAFRAGAGPASDAKRTAENTEEIRDILIEIRDGEGMELQPAGLRRS